MYNKLFTKILDSSIWLESAATRLVWLTFIAVMDEHGFVQFAAPANVAHRARVTLEEAEEALRTLENPDPNSSNPNNDGRRIERVPGGWVVLNAKEHREMVTRAVQREQTAKRVQRFREKKRSGNASVTPSEAEAEPTTPAGSDSGYPPEFDDVWAMYPKRAGGNSKADTFARWKARRREGISAEALHDGVTRYATFCAATGRTGTEYVKQGATFFGRGRHWEEPWNPPPPVKRVSKQEAARQEIGAYLDAKENGNGH